MRLRGRSRRSAEGFPVRLAGPRRPADEQIAHGTIRSVGIDAVVGHPLSEIAEPLAVLGRAEDAERDDRCRMRVAGDPLDVDGQCRGVDGDQVTAGPRGQLVVRAVSTSSCGS